MWHALTMKKSAGLLMYRRTGDGSLEVLIAHPGGPYWRGKDEGAWTIPKGEYDENEEPLAAAIREFGEETSFPVSPPFLPLGAIVQKSGKRITAWAFEGDCDPARLRSNTFEIEWPPRSGRMSSFPEIDRVEWLSPDAARRKINPAQCALLDRLALATRDLPS
jgi:predicted NUDIX family NTP pyrophosphohydrolase